MTGTGITITEEERKHVEVAQSVSGMWLSGGQPMSDPAAMVARLAEKYKAPKGSGLNIRTGEFMLP